MASEATFDAHADRHRVTVWLRLRRADFEDDREQQRVFGLENSVMRALDESGAGEHDTNSLENGYFAMRLVGDDADAVVAVILPLLADAADGQLPGRSQGPGRAAPRTASAWVAAPTPELTRWARDRSRAARGSRSGRCYRPFDGAARDARPAAGRPLTSGRRRGRRSIR